MLRYGEIRTIRVLQKQKAAFVHFTSRGAAEKAAAASHPALVIKGRKLKIMWGRGKDQAGGRKALPAGGSGPLDGGAPPGIGGPGGGSVGFLPPPLAAPGGRPIYESMDSQRMGARSAQPIKGAHQKGPQ